MTHLFKGERQKLAGFRSSQFERRPTSCDHEANLLPDPLRPVRVSGKQTLMPDGALMARADRVP
jgi:hypothetical protein